MPSSRIPLQNIISNSFSNGFALCFGFSHFDHQPVSPIIRHLSKVGEGLLILTQNTWSQPSFFNCHSWFFTRQCNILRWKLYLPSSIYISLQTLNFVYCHCGWQWRESIPLPPREHNQFCFLGSRLQMAGVSSGFELTVIVMILLHHFEAWIVILFQDTPTFHY